MNEGYAKQLGIDTNSYKDFLEEKLSKAGIQLYRNDSPEFYITGRPEILINIKPVNNISANIINCMVETSFKLTLRTFSNPKATNRSSLVSWLTYQPQAKRDQIFDIVDSHIDSFADSVCKPHNGNICNSKNK